MFGWMVVFHTFNPSTWESEAGGCMSSRPAWAIQTIFCVRVRGQSVGAGSLHPHTGAGDQFKVCRHVAALVD